MGEEAQESLCAIEILEIEPPRRPLLEQVTRTLSGRVAVPCRMRDRSPLLELPHIPGRNQVDADRLLALVGGMDREEGTALIALTRFDIGNPIFTHFFGLARNGGMAAVVSTARLDPSFYGLPADEGLTARRTVLEILHELGHVAGLGHCDDYGCLMRFAPVVEQIDNRGVTYCAACSPHVPDALAPLRSD